MLKEKVENKAEKIPDSITARDGRTYRKVDYEDAGHPGFTRPGMLVSSLEIELCAGWGLVSASGHPFWALLPVPVLPDPTRISASEAPEALRRAVADAEKRLKEAEVKIAAALEKRTQAEEAQLRAARRADKSAYNRAVAEAAAAEEQRKDLELALPKVRVELSHANEALKFWLNDESLYRCGAAQRPEPSDGIF